MGTISEKYLELKKIGYVKLGTQAERDEYSALKKEVEAGNGDKEYGAATPSGDAPEVANKAEDSQSDPGEETLTLTRSQLEKMIADQVTKNTVDSERRIKGLERQVGMGDWRVAKKNKPTLRTAKFKKYRKNSKAPEGLIIDWQHHEFQYDERTRQYDKDVYLFTVAYPQEGQPFDKWEQAEVEMTLEDFAKINQYETVTILKRDTEIAERSHGQVRRRLKDKEGYTYLNEGMVGSEMVELLETKEVATCLVELPSGDTFTIAEDRLNA